VLKRFKHKPPTDPDKFASLMESDWRRRRQVVKSVVKEEGDGLWCNKKKMMTIKRLYKEQKFERNHSNRNLD
jgi:hypothetical protein